MVAAGLAASAAVATDETEMTAARETRSANITSRVLMERCRVAMVARRVVVMGANLSLLEMPVARVRMTARFTSLGIPSKHPASQVYLKQNQLVTRSFTRGRPVAPIVAAQTLSHPDPRSDEGASGLPPQVRYVRPMKLKGTIRRSDLEGGHWTFETSDGKTYQLTGHLADAKDGMHATIEGKIDKSVMGIGMTGPHFAVEKVVGSNADNAGTHKPDGHKPDGHKTDVQ